MDYNERINSLLGEDLIIFKGDADSEVILDCMKDLDVSSFNNKINSLSPDDDTRRYFLTLYRMTKCLNLEYIVELGVREAYSTVSFLEGMSAEGKLVSFDPQLNGNILLNRDDARWNYFPELDYVGYEKYGDQFVNFDALYIDTDDHSYNQLKGQLNNWWIKNIKKGGYLILDDCSPFHQEETFGNRPTGFFDVGAKFGVLHGALEFIDENYKDIEYAFSVENNFSNGTTVIKFRG